MRVSISPAKQARRVFALACAVTSVVASAQAWDALSRDGIHDPRGPAVKELQEPAAALSKLTPDNAGNMVRWVQSLQ